MPRSILPLLAAALCFALVVAAPARAEDKPAHKTIGVEEFERVAKEPGVVVLDVRTGTEYRKGHLKDATLIDIQQPKEFEQKIKALDKSKTYAVYCAIGGRSAKACKQLDALGFAKVYNLDGGIKAWEKAGKPVEK